MKTSTVLIILLFSIVGKAQTIENFPNAIYEFVYEFEFQSDSNDVNATWKERMLLQTTQNKSIFISLDGIEREKMIMEQIKTGHIDLRKSPKSRFSTIITKNNIEKSTKAYHSSWDLNYSYTESEVNFNWKIAPEYKTISGYKCQKATGYYRGRNYIAWFSSEIPLSEGPYKFNKLPGLIVKVHDTKHQVKFTLVKTTLVNGKPTIFSREASKYIETTPEGFDKAYKSFRNNLRGYAEGMQEKFRTSPGQMELAIENLKRKNNRIELE